MTRAFAYFAAICFLVSALMVGWGVFVVHHRTERCLAAWEACQR